MSAASSSVARRADTVIEPPGGVNLIALWTRLRTTWPSRAPSPKTWGVLGSTS